VSDFSPVRGITLSHVPGSHQALPVGDSWYNERTQHPANLLSEFDYPVIAVCTRRSGRIRLARKTQMEWVHVSAEQPGARSTAEGARAAGG
jgi:hypothetical protein